VIGLIFAAPIAMIWAQEERQDSIVMVCIAAVILPTMAAGLTFSIYALRGAPLRNGIELNSHGVRAMWRVGPFRGCRRTNWGEVMQLLVVPAWNVPGFVEVEGGFLLQLTRMRGKPILLAGDDDRGRLLGLANELARRAIAARGAAFEALTVPPLVEVVEEESRDVVSDRDEQPAGSTATLEQHDDGVTITVPPTGMQGLLEDQAILPVLAIAVALTTWIAVATARAVAESGPVGVFTFEGAYIAWPGVLILAANVASAFRRSGQLEARHGVLTVRWTGLLGTRKRTWHRDELAEIRVASERIKSEGTMEWSQSLAIRPRDLSTPAPRHLLDWREKAELEWIATKLRRALGLPSNQPKPGAAADGWDDKIA
jgi:hypothetical protein